MDMAQSTWNDMSTEEQTQFVDAWEGVPELKVIIDKYNPCPLNPATGRPVEEERRAE